MKTEPVALGKSPWTRYRPMIILAVILVILPFILPNKMMAIEILCWAFPTLGFILLLGYTGLLHFGLGCFFAAGAFTTGILLARYDTHILLAIFAGALVAGLLSVIVGWFCIKRVGIIFALLTLAFNQLIWFIIYQWKSMTGGPDGIWGIYRSTMDFGIFAINIRPVINLYYLVAIIFFLAFLFTRRLVGSPFGKVLLGMRESELRATAIGYNPETYKWVAFIVCGVLAGVGGGLYALHQEYVGEHLAYWSTGGEMVMMALIGGIFSLYGALIGAGVFILLSDLLSVVWARWMLIFGVIFILLIIFLKGGIWSGGERLYEMLRRSLGVRRKTPPQT